MGILASIVAAQTAFRKLEEKKPKEKPKGMTWGKSNPGVQLPKLPGQVKPPKLFPPTLPETRIPTPFGDVHLPEYKVKLPKLPSLEEKNRDAMLHAIAIDASMVPGLIPYVGDIVADIVEDLHAAELRKILTPKEYDEFVKQDKVAPATVAIMRALTKGE